MLVDSAISLSLNVQAYKYEQCPYRLADIRSLLSSIIEAERGLIPSTGEIDILVNELIEGDSEDSHYTLCDKDTRLPLEGNPTTYNYDDPNNEDLEARGLLWIPTKVVEQEEAVRQAKEKAEADAERERTRRYITTEEYQSVLAYARTNGKFWKRALRKAWVDGTAPEVLLYLFTHPNFGEDWLENFSLSKGFFKTTEKFPG